MRYSKPSVLIAVKANSAVANGSGHGGMGVAKQNFILPEVVDPTDYCWSTTGAYEADE
jgi:hypothetical protein